METIKRLKREIYIAEILARIKEDEERRKIVPVRKCKLPS